MHTKKKDHKRSNFARTPPKKNGMPFVMSYLLPRPTMSHSRLQLKRSRVSRLNLLQPPQLRTMEGKKKIKIARSSCRADRFTGLFPCWRAVEKRNRDRRASECVKAGKATSAPCFGACVVKGSARSPQRRAAGVREDGRRRGAARVKTGWPDPVAGPHVAFRKSCIRWFLGFDLETFKSPSLWCGIVEALL